MDRFKGQIFQNKEQLMNIKEQLFTAVLWKVVPQKRLSVWTMSKGIVGDGG